mmetsp:Transcript_98153/g.204749  ORF Transcript_98153/g.204749 Transcript_98153/m.204749 type:complete len:109 (+) Transcript_98153:74-400(+)
MNIHSASTKQVVEKSKCRHCTSKMEARRQGGWHITHHKQPNTTAQRTQSQHTEHRDTEHTQNTRTETKQPKTRKHTTTKHTHNTHTHTQPDHKHTTTHRRQSKKGKTT